MADEDNQSRETTIDQPIDLHIRDSEYDRLELCLCGPRPDHFRPPHFQDEVHDAGKNFLVFLVRFVF